MVKNTGKKFVTQGKNREFYLGLNVATLMYFCNEGQGISMAQGIVDVHFFSDKKSTVNLPKIPVLKIF